MAQAGSSLGSNRDVQTLRSCLPGGPPRKQACFRLFFETPRFCLSGGPTGSNHRYGPVQHPVDPVVNSRDRGASDSRVSLRRGCWQLPRMCFAEAFLFGTHALFQGARAFVRLSVFIGFRGVLFRGYVCLFNRKLCFFIQHMDRRLNAASRPLHTCGGAGRC